MSEWTPLVEGPAAAEILTLVDEIAGCARHLAISDVTIANGAAAAALLFAYLHRARSRASDRAAAERILASTLRAAKPASLHVGFAGPAWVAAHLDLVDEDLDEAVLAHARAFTERDPWDLRSGLIGLGVYCRERSTPAARACLELAATNVRALARVTPQGRSWLIRPEHLPEAARVRHPRGLASLGMAHGTASVIAFLAATHDARAELADAARWLFTQRLAEGDLPATVSADGTPGPASPMCWCNGAPGIAAGLAQADLPDELRAATLELAVRTAARPVDTVAVPDASLCCGSAGIALCFARLFARTGVAELGTAARAWFLRTLAQTRHDAAYRSGLLRGHPGIALALLAAVAPIEPSWDRLLLLS